MKFLVVEDCREADNFLKAIFGETEIHVLHAARLSEAHQLTKDEHPSLILMDVCLPDGIGLDAAQALRPDPAATNIPIITVCGLDTVQLGGRARSSGCLTSFPRRALPG